MNEKQELPQTSPDATDPQLTMYPINETEQRELDNVFTYHAPKADQATRYEGLRREAAQLAITIRTFCPPSRERSLALTRIEEAAFWANASIARHE